MPRSTNEAKPNLTERKKPPPRSIEEILAEGSGARAKEESRKRRSPFSPGGVGRDGLQVEAALCETEVSSNSE